MKFLSPINVNTEYALPFVDGTNGQVLTTDGNGAVYWGSVSAGSANLNALTDVELTNPTSGQILRYAIPPGGTLPVWYNWTPTFLTAESDTLSTVTSRGASTSYAVTFNGDVSIGTAADLSFGSAVRQMINLWSTGYGIGVQSSTTYFRSDSGFAWFRGGVHNNTANNPGAEGVLAMRIDASSNLVVTGSTTASSFVKTGGTASQFLKADGSVDTNTYLTSYTETDTLATVTGRGATTTNSITVGGLTATNPMINSAGTSNDNSVMQWRYGSNDSYRLRLKQTVTSGVVRWNFSQTNNDTDYNDVLVLDRGRVGIGTTSPDDKFVVAGVIKSIGGTNNGKYSQIFVNDSYAYYTTNASVIYMNKELQISGGFIGSYDGDLSLRTSGTTRISVENSTGNVGIGTASAREKLQVVGNTVIGSAGLNSYKTNLYLTYNATTDETWFRIYLPQDYASSNNGGTVRVRVLWEGDHATFGAYQEYQISYKTFYPASPYLKFSNVLCTNKTSDFSTGSTYYPPSSTPDVLFYDNTDGYLYVKVKGTHSAYNTARYVEAEIFGRTTSQPTIATTTAPSTPVELTKTIEILPQEGNLYVSNRVGIGTTSPSAKLDVNGAANATSFSSTALFITNADTSGSLQPEQGDPANKIYSFRWQGNEGGYIDTDNKITFSGFKTPAGTSSQFLKANGTVDSNTYVTSTALNIYATIDYVDDEIVGVNTYIGNYFVPNTRTLTINGTAFDLSANRSWTIDSADGYISDVRLQESTLEFAGEGSAFTGNIDLSTLPFAASSHTHAASDITSGTLSTDRLPKQELGISIAGNFGQWQIHSTYTNFNTEVAYWGWNYVQGNTNAPHQTSSQWYRGRFSLGSEYGFGGGGGDYWLEIAIPRYSQGNNAGNLFVRTAESGVTTAWQGVRGAYSTNAGYAVSSGNSETTDQTNFSELFIEESPVATEEYVTSQGYITGESDTLATVTGRGNSTTTALYLAGGSAEVPALHIRSGGYSWSEGLAIHPSTDSGYGLTFYRTRAAYTDQTNTWAIGNLGDSNALNHFGLLRKGLTGGVADRAGDAIFTINPTGAFKFGFNPYVGTNLIWHAGNDGSGSGLDADLLDGVQLDNVVWGNARGTNDSITTDNNSLDKTGYYTSGAFETKPSGVSNWMYIEHIKLYNSNTRYQKQIGYDTYDDRMWVRTNNNGTWSSWKQIWTSDVFTNNSTDWNTAYGWGNHADAPYWNVGLTDDVTVAASSVRFGGNVRVDGDLEVLGTITETSSIRFKENITPLDPALDKVSQLEAVSYNKIGVDDREIGLIAEDVVGLFPEVVTYNEEGQPQGIQYQRLSVILLKAVQELSQEVNELKKKLN